MNVYINRQQPYKYVITSYLNKSLGHIVHDDIMVGKHGKEAYLMAKQFEFLYFNWLLNNLAGSLDILINNKRR